MVASATAQAGVDLKNPISHFKHISNTKNIPTPVQKSPEWGLLD